MPKPGDSEAYRAGKKRDRGGSVLRRGFRKTVRTSASSGNDSLRQWLSGFGVRLLKSIYVFFELALSVRGLVLVNHTLSGEAVQVSLHVV